MQTIQAMAARMVRMIRAVQPEGPYRIGGWSFGGTLAYEIATQLIGDDEPVDFLGIFDGIYFGPGTNVPQKLLSDDGFNDEDLFSQMQTGKYVYQKQSLLPAELSSDEVHLYLKRNQNHFDAARNYVATPIPIPLHLFVAEDRGNMEYDSAYHGWDVILPVDQIRTISVPGNHISMMELPHVASLGEALSLSIRQARESRSPLRGDMEIG